VSGAASFRIAPNALESGDAAVVHVEWVPPDLAGEAVVVDLVESAPDGEDRQVVASFRATIAGASPETFAFEAAERLPVAADVEGDMELPEPASETSRDGAITVPGTEATWERAHVHLRLEGCPEEHVVIARVADASDASRREGGVFELGLVVRREGGGAVFESGSQVALLDCWRALAANCVRAVEGMYAVHQHLCSARDTGGDYYGSASHGSPKQGKRVTDCVTFAVQVLERAYGELRAEADYRYLHTKKGDYERWHVGSLFAPALHELGWSLLLFGADAEDLRSRRELDYVAAIFGRAEDEGTLWGRPVEVVADHQPLADWDTGARRPPDAAALARFDALEDAVPFGVCALGLGNHVVMKVGSRVYECHWGAKATDPDLFDRGRTWQDLKGEDCYYMAAPAYALREAEASGGDGAAPEGG